MVGCKAIVLILWRVVRARVWLALGYVALRQQLAVLHRSGKCPQFRQRDRLFWVLLSAIWSDWSSALVIVKPETVMRRRTRRYWRWPWKVQKAGRPVPPRNSVPS